MTSNQASTASSAAVTAAASRYLSSRLFRSRPVAARPSASRLSRPVHAAAQCAAWALAGSCVARANSHGIMPTPTAIRARPSQGLAPGRAARLAPGRAGLPLVSAAADLVSAGASLISTGASRRS